jgi:hypothetical protein
MTTKKLALAASIVLLSGISGAAYAGTAIHAKTHRVAHASSPQIPVEISRAYASTAAVADQGPHYHGGPKYND